MQADLQPLLSEFLERFAGTGVFRNVLEKRKFKTFELALRRSGEFGRFFGRGVKCPGGAGEVVWEVGYIDRIRVLAHS